MVGMEVLLSGYVVDSIAQLEAICFEIFVKSFVGFKKIGTAFAVPIFEECPGFNANGGSIY